MAYVCMWRGMQCTRVQMHNQYTVHRTIDNKFNNTITINIINDKLIYRIIIECTIISHSDNLTGRLLYFGTIIYYYITILLYTTVYYILLLLYLSTVDFPETKYR